MTLGTTHYLVVIQDVLQLQITLPDLTNLLDLASNNFLLFSQNESKSNEQNKTKNPQNKNNH